MPDNNPTADRIMGGATSNKKDTLEGKSSVVESVPSTASCGDGDDEKERDDASPTEKPEPRDEMLEAALKVVANSTSFFARAGLVATLPEPLPASPQRRITIHLVRHAEGPHNLISIAERERLNMLDPGLTNYGLAQCVHLSERFHAMDKITHIVASPLRRTVHTALGSFKPAIKRGIKIILCPDLRECGGGQCNTGSNIDDVLKDLLSIEDDLPKDCVDGGLCEPGWELGTETWEEKHLRTERAARVRSMLYHLGKMAADTSSDDVEIVVVTHSRLLMLLAGHTNRRYGYHNAEYRSYRLTTDEEVAAGVDMYKLIETQESRNYIHTFPDVPYED
ncbi:hypothetical protein IFR05_001473 [Cadophora sp. M221]|nr:hypothetical protein IFR05_001473 [Cadophora sp. M221]